MTALSQEERVPALARLLGGSEITEFALGECARNVGFSEVDEFCLKAYFLVTFQKYLIEMLAY